MANQVQKNAKAAQDLVPIREIRDGIVILKNGGLRALLMCSTVNFELKSADEQDGILMQYQNFINTVDFTVQVFITSRALDIDPYLETLRERADKETQELLRVQIIEYMEFVRNFVATEQIVSRSFYAVVPYGGTLAPAGGGTFSFFNKKTPTTAQEKFEEQRAQLMQRVGTVEQGLSRIGVRTAMLSTEELIELYYRLYNPGESKRNVIASLGQEQ